MRRRPASGLTAACAALLLGLLAAFPVAAAPSGTVPPVAPVEESEGAAVLRRQIETPDPGWAASRAEQEDLQRLYRPDAGLPLWFDTAGRADPQAEAALTLLERAADEGLEPADYRAGELRQRVRRLRAEGSTAGFPETAALDVALSRAVLRYLRHLHLGRVDPRSLGFRVPAPAAAPDFAERLRAALAEHRLAETAAALAPAHAQYRELRRMLARHRALADDPAFAAPLPAPPATLRPGQTWSGLRALHARLLRLGDLPEQTPPPAEGAPYGGALVEGVKRFQARHTLAPDGVAGRSTWAALNVPPGERVRQIGLAMERLRWLAPAQRRPFLAINIPMYRLAAWEPEAPQETPALRMNVIVGRALDTQTPVLAEDMRYIVFRPYWNVPRSIVRDEILPALARDPGYLRRHDMELVRGGGDEAPAVEATPAAIEELRQGGLRLRQRPGPRNALGLVKFIFPNDEAVYLHGTPAQSLFGRSRRDFSHGCVRVEDPVALAAWLLKDRPEWTRERIEAAMKGTRPLRVDLAQPVPVLLYYLTAAVLPGDGRLHFAEDIYGHDRRLAQALARRARP